MYRRFEPNGIPFNGFEIDREDPQAHGLVAWWPTEGLKGSGILRDYAGTVSLAVSSPSWRVFPSGLVGPDYSSTESTGYASSTLAGLTCFTLSAWVLPDTLGYTTDILCIYDEASRGWLWRIKDIRALSFFTAGHGDTTGGSSLNAGTLYHVAMSHDRSTRALKFYINGALTYSGTHFATFNMPNVGDPVVVGRDNYDGGIFDVRIYNYVKSDAEVLQLYTPQTRYDLYDTTAPRRTYRSASAAAIIPVPTPPAPHAASNAALTLYRPPKQLQPQYEIYLTDIYTRRLALVRRLESLTYSKTLNGVGEFELTLPSSFDASLVREGGGIEIHRAHERGLSPELDFYGFILSQPKYFVNGGGKFIKVGGADVNHMLTWREQVGYTATSELLDYVDDNMRYLVDVNLGLGSAAARSLYAAYGATVEPDRGAARVMYLQVNRRPLLDYLNDLARQSSENSYKRVKLFYGMVVTQLNPLRVQFQVRPQLWGQDRTINSSLPVVLRAQRGLRNAILEQDATDEKTAIYVEYNGGTIPAAITNDARLNTWPGGRREGYRNVNDTGDGSIAADAARVALRAQKRVYRARGEIEQRRGAAYGDYRVGDHVTLSADDQFSTVRVHSASVTVAGGQETVQVRYEYVD